MLKAVAFEMCGLVDFGAGINSFVTLISRVPEVSQLGRRPDARWHRRLAASTIPDSLPDAIIGATHFYI